VPTWTPTPRPTFSLTPAPNLHHDNGKHLGQLKHPNKGKGKAKGHGK
jgi:hypothetical protein